MLKFIRNLFSSKNFWGTLAVINLVGIAAQPLLLIFTALVILALYAVLGLGNVVQSRRFPRFLLCCLFLGLWVTSAAIVGTAFETLGLTTKTRGDLLVVALVTVLLWAVPILVYRRIQRSSAHKKAQMDQEKAQKERAAQAEESRRRAAAQRRRDDASNRCEVFWHTHAPEIHKRFSRAMFDDFMRQQMGNDQPPETVEERATQLLGIMQQHLAKAGHGEQKRSLADLAAWFLEEKTKIEALPLNPEDKEQMIADLEARFTQLQQKYIRSMNP